MPARSHRGSPPCRSSASPSPSVTPTTSTTSAKRLKARGIRVEVDHSDERMQKKIRNAQTQKVPYMVIVGDHDIDAGAVSFRYRSGDQDNGVPVDEAIERIVESIEKRLQV